MEFIKVGKNYLIKGSNGRIVSEKEKLQLENNELTIKNEDCGCACPDKIKKIAKNKKKIKKLEEEPTIEDKIKEKTTEIWKKEFEEKFEINTAPEKEVDADDTIKETDNTL